MKKHLCTIILLLIAIVAFLFGFKVSGICKTVCDLMAFALPTIAAVVEIMLSEKSSRRIEEEFNKRPPVVVLSQEEYERRQAEGTIEKGTIYATTEDSND